MIGDEAQSRMSRRFLKFAGIFTVLHLFLFVGFGFGSIWFNRQTLIQRGCQFAWLVLIQPAPTFWEWAGANRDFFHLSLTLDWTLLLLNSTLWGAAVALFVVNRNKAMRATVLASFALIALIAWDPLPAHYTGDGSFSDHGRYSYPRYVVTFHDMPLYESSERRLRLQGLPTGTMALKLYVKNWSRDGSDKADLLRDLRATVDVSVIDRNSQELCRASGTPEFHGDLNKELVLTESNDTAAFYLLPCSNIRVRQGHSYELTLRVTATALKSNEINIIPTLEGGGEENADD